MDDDKLSGRIVIDTVLANMRQQVEELRYSKVVPSAYDVYLHPDDEQRFERVISVRAPAGHMQEQVQLRGRGNDQPAHAFVAVI